jgi:hypothetical protein
MSTVFPWLIRVLASRSLAMISSGRYRFKFGDDLFRSVPLHRHVSLLLELGLRA